MPTCAGKVTSVTLIEVYELAELGKSPQIRKFFTINPQIPNVQISIKYCTILFKMNVLFVDMYLQTCESFNFAKSMGSHSIANLQFTNPQITERLG